MTVGPQYPKLYVTRGGRYYIALKSPDGRRASRSLGCDEAIAKAHYPGALAALRARLGLSEGRQTCERCRREVASLAWHTRSARNVCRACCNELRGEARRFQGNQGNHDLRAVMEEARWLRTALAPLDAAVRRYRGRS